MKKVALIILAILITIGFIAYKGYSAIWGNNLNSEVDKHTLYIPEDALFQTVIDSLSQGQILKNIEEFKLTAKLMKYGDNSVKTGRYDLSQLSTNRQILSKLRIGDQDPINVIINGGRTIEEVTERIADQLTFTASDLKAALTTQDLLTEWKANKETLLTKIVPDTYEMYWNISAEQFIKRMQEEYNRYWTEGLISQANDQGLTPDEVMILASIVEKETNNAREYPVIGGVYLNRLKRGMLLQADPTVVFANGDFGIRRVLNKHLRKDSPYNTYMYAGLPPGPICLPSKGAINGVLKPINHKFLYFCAQPNYSGKHDFSKNLTQHNNYANTYRRWLSKQGIKK